MADTAQLSIASRGLYVLKAAVLGQGVAVVAWFCFCVLLLLYSTEILPWVWARERGSFFARTVARQTSVVVLKRLYADPFQR